MGEVHIVGHARRRGSRKATGKPKAPTKAKGKNVDQQGSWGHNDPDYFLYKRHTCGERRAIRRWTGVYGVDLEVAKEGEHQASRRR